MSDTAFDEIEREALSALGFSITETTTLAHVEEVMTLDAVPHDGFYFLLTITLPGGATVTSYCRRTRFWSETVSEAAAKHMSDTKFNENERRKLAALGFSIANATVMLKAP